MEKEIYSIRMHSSLDAAHLSGAERLCGEEELQSLASAMVGRALGHSRGKADSITLTVESLEPGRVDRGRLPDLTTVLVEDHLRGREAASCFLEDAGVSLKAVRAAMVALASGAAPDGKSMRGAMLVDAESGERLEPDRARGVRASRMGLTLDALSELKEGLSLRGLDNDHVREALVLAAKVLSAPAVVAELAWSDDPEYTAGYVTTRELGYLRFPHLKPLGEERGGRAFFLRRQGLDLEAVITHLESKPLLIGDIGKFNPDRNWER